MTSPKGARGLARGTEFPHNSIPLKISPSYFLANFACGGCIILPTVWILNNKSRIKEYEALCASASSFRVTCSMAFRAVLARNNAVYYYRVGTLLLAVVFLAVAPCGCPCLF